MIRFLITIVICVAHCGGAAAPDRVAWLRGELNRHDRLYWEELSPEISDSEYDALAAEWRDLTGRQWRAGDIEAEWTDRVAHRTPMLSLEKLHTEVDWHRFLGRMERRGVAPERFRLEPKYDGVALSLVYKRGELAYALTRGDGREGRVVTANVLRVSAIPEIIPALQNWQVVEVRGELYATLAQFERINDWRSAMKAHPYPLPRHAVAALLRVNDIGTLPEKTVSFVAFELRSAPRHWEPESQSETIQWLESLGFAVPKPSWEHLAKDEVLKKVSQFAELRHRLNYPTDGLVIKVEARNQQEQLGHTARAPRWAAAWKYPGETAVTEIQSIVESTGATGRITPVAHIRPVNLEGVTVHRVSLHSRQIVENHGLQPGSIIRIHLGGGIVPAILLDQKAVTGK
ncbi:MAG: hypothetical protein LR015_07850 [Verrucomicrobia bacterium]|nr:hypothetical protein [Verrucomicrobiota bacterium]